MSNKVGGESNHSRNDSAHVPASDGGTPDQVAWTNLCHGQLEEPGKESDIPS